MDFIVRFIRWIRFWGQQARPRGQHEERLHQILASINQNLKEAKEAKEAAEKARKAGKQKKEEEIRKKYESISYLSIAANEKEVFMILLPRFLGKTFEWWYKTLKKLDKLIDDALAAGGEKPPDYKKMNEKIKELLDEFLRETDLNQALKGLEGPAKDRINEMVESLTKAKEAKEAAEEAQKAGDEDREVAKKTEAIKALEYAANRKEAFMMFCPPIYLKSFHSWYETLSQLDEFIDEAKKAGMKKPPDYREMNKKIKEAIKLKEEIENNWVP